MHTRNFRISPFDKNCILYDETESETCPTLIRKMSAFVDENRINYEGFKLEHVSHYCVRPSQQNLLQTHIVDRCRVLDVGCGSGIWTEFLLKNGAGFVQGIDLSPQQIKMAESKNLTNAKFTVSDIACVNYSHEFDLAIALNSLQFARNRDHFCSCLQAIYKSLNSYGRLLIAYPNVIPKSLTEHYGFWYEFEGSEPELGSRVKFNSTSNFQYEMHYIPPEILEFELAKVGFNQIVWKRPHVTAAGLEKFGYEYWQNFVEIPIDWYIEAIK